MQNMNFRDMECMGRSLVHGTQCCSRILSYNILVYPSLPGTPGMGRLTVRTYEHYTSILSQHNTC